METKHCPHCNSTSLGYAINIFKERTDKDYYTGAVTCNQCKSVFSKEDIKTRYWKEDINKKLLKVL